MILKSNSCPDGRANLHALMLLYVLLIGNKDAFSEIRAAHKQQDGEREYRCQPARKEAKEDKQIEVTILTGQRGRV